MLHEAIPITGTIVSGTYYIASTTTQTNIKRYSHGMFESVFDYPHLSSSANHIFDLSVGYSNASSLSSSNFTQNNKKINIYNQMAQVLAGHDATGSIRRFDQNGDFADGGTKHDEVFFINYSRLLVKDEIKKGSWTLAVATGGSVSTQSLVPFRVEMSRPLAIMALRPLIRQTRPPVSMESSIPVRLPLEATVRPVWA